MVDDNDADGPPDTKKKFQCETPEKPKDKYRSHWCSTLKELTSFQEGKGK